MNYQVVVDWAPAYELISSLDAYLLNMARNMDLGADWVDGVRARLHGPLQGVSKWSHCDAPFVLAILVRQSPEPRTAASFLAWLGGLAPGEAYELLLPYLPPSASELLRRLPEFLGEYTILLTAWNEQQFRAVDPGILGRLESEVTRRRERAAELPPVDLIEEATTGLVIESDEIDVVLLIPHYHVAPINRYTKCNRTLLIWYPLERLAEPGLPPARLVRMAKALGDENRLRVLHFLADAQPHTFTEVLKFTGLAKNSVHYHLMALRAAGLTRVHITGECCNERYTARRTTIDQFGPGLQQYLDER